MATSARVEIGSAQRLSRTPSASLTLPRLSSVMRGRCELVRDGLRPTCHSQVRLIVNLRPWIARALWSGAASLGIGLVAGLLSLVLKAAGDGSGAAAVRGVMLVAISVGGLAVVALVVLLAAHELQKPDDK